MINPWNKTGYIKLVSFKFTFAAPIEAATIISAINIISSIIVCFIVFLPVPIKVLIKVPIKIYIKKVNTK